MSEPAEEIVPIFNFTHDPSASPFAANLRAYLSAHPDEGFQYVGTGALVFDTINPTTPRILLLQRSASDSMPNRWEIPGGGCDEEDESIMHAVARELWEEAGLKAKHISAPVGGPHLFVSSSGKQVCKFSFVVQVDESIEGQAAEVKLDPKEHQRYLWASENEIRNGKVKDVELDFASKELESTVLQAFDQSKNERRGMS